MLTSIKAIFSFPDSISKIASQIKKYLLLLLVLAGLVFILTGCGAGSNSSSNSTETTTLSATTPAGPNSKQPVTSAASPAAAEVKPAEKGGPPPEDKYLKIKFPPLNYTTGEKTLKITGWAAADLKVTVNDREIAVDEEGNFTATIELKPGPNLITLAAYDQKRFNQTAPTAVRRLNVQYNAPPPRLVVAAPSSTTQEWVTISGETDPNCLVYVNDNQVKVDRRGRFTAPVRMTAPGNNTIRVTATDGDGVTAAAVKTINFIVQPPPLYAVVPESSREQSLTITGYTDTISAVTIIVNEKPAVVDNRDGKFTAQINLQPGVNNILIQAVNKWGMENTTERLVTYNPPTQE